MAVRGGQDDGQGAPGLHPDDRRATRPQAKVAVGTDGESGVAPGEGVRPRVPSPQGTIRAVAHRVEDDLDVRRPATDLDVARENGRGQQPLADVADQCIAQDDLGPVRAPCGGEFGRTRAVLSRRHLVRRPWRHLERAPFGSADEGTEHRRGVEAGDTEPVDGAVGGHQARGTRVADQPVVTDRRCRGGHRAEALHRRFSPRAAPMARPAVRAVWGSERRNCGSRIPRAWAPKRP